MFAKAASQVAPLTLLPNRVPTSSMVQLMLTTTTKRCTANMMLHAITKSRLWPTSIIAHLVVHSVVHLSRTNYSSLLALKVVKNLTLQAMVLVIATSTLLLKLPSKLPTNMPNTQALLITLAHATLTPSHLAYWLALTGTLTKTISLPFVTSSTMPTKTLGLLVAKSITLTTLAIASLTRRTQLLLNWTHALAISSTMSSVLRPLMCATTAKLAMKDLPSSLKM